MEMHEVIREQRTAQGISQADLAEQVGVDKRQIRRYEAGEAQPSLSVAKAIAKALHISIDELAGEEARRVDLAGNWWACWQSWKNGEETINPHEIHFRQQGEKLLVTAVTRGTPVEGGGYLWEGELRLWDNEILMGWYVSTEGAIRSKGTMYFVLHPHGISMTGRWVGLSYDGPIISGWGAIARTEGEVIELMNQLRSSEGISA
jgi:transcriptional regulator with XRE-family HTH domain